MSEEQVNEDMESEELRGISHVKHEIADLFEEDFFETKKVIYISY